MAREGMPFATDTAAGRLLEAMATAVIVIDAGGRIAWLNAAAGDLLALGPGAARGRRLGELLVDGGAAESLVLRVRISDEPLTRRECPLTPAARSDASYQVDITATPLPPTSGAGSVLLEIADTTRQARMTRDAALLAQQGGSRLMARQLAHEIKNPLGGLRGAAQLLERELPNEELKEYTRVIIGEADRLRALVDGLLGPARPLAREPVNVHEILEHVRKLMLVEVPVGLTLERQYDPSLPEFEGEPEQLIQAVLNIVRNSAEAIQHQGVIRLRTRIERSFTIGQKRHRLVLRADIEDHGPGIPEEIRKHIFYPMVTAKPGGTGLGLSIAQDIIAKHGGLIECDSRPGLTVFSIYLPLENGHGY